MQVKIQLWCPFSTHSYYYLFGPIFEAFCERNNATPQFPTYNTALV